MGRQFSTGDNSKMKESKDTESTVKVKPKNTLIQTTNQVWLQGIPNLITLANLTSGLLGIGLLMGGDLFGGFLCMLLGSFFDFFDGMLARKLGVEGNMGKQLDSLADLVSFGVLPGLIWKSIMIKQGYCTSDSFSFSAYVWLLIPLGAAYRLAKFNVQETDSSDFMGIPTPITGMALGSLSYIFMNANYQDILPFIDQPLLDIRFVFQNHLLWLFLPVVSSYMMISEIPMLSMKGKVKDAKHLYRLLLLALALPCLVFGWAGVLVFYFLYIILSLLSNFAVNKSR